MLDQILTDPADDALRLVYADRLLADGDERGEYITVDTLLAATPRGSSEHAELARRRAELRAAHGHQWWPELPEHRIGTRHGFAETVAVFASELGVLPRLAAREPIAALELIDAPPGAPLPGGPWQRRIRRLVLHDGPGYGDSMVPWEGPLGEAVEELAITSRRFDPHSLAAGRLPRCRSLCLAGSHLEDAARGRILRRSTLRELAGWELLARLEVLDLSACRLSVTAVHELVSLELAALRVLRLSGNALGDDGAIVLANHMCAFPALERLELVEARIGSRGAAALRSADPRVELVLEAGPPSRIALDALGSELELFPVNESEWAVVIDGARRPIRVRTRGSWSEAIDTVSERALLGPVVRALRSGAPRRMVSNGVAVAVGPYDEAVLAVARDRSELQYEPPLKQPPFYSATTPGRR